MSQPPSPLLSAPYSLPGLRPHSAQITSGRLPPSSSRAYRPSSADKSRKAPPLPLKISPSSQEKAGVSSPLSPSI